MDKDQINTLLLDTKIEIAHESSLIYSISPNNNCSFCDKKSHEVKKIFKGKYATICDECVELCEEIIEEEVEERIKGGIDMRSTSSDLMCSFCARAHIDPDLFILIAGPGKYICDKCTLVFVDELKFL